MKRKMRRMIAALAAIPLAVYSVPASAVETQSMTSVKTQAVSTVIIDVTAADMTEIRESGYEGQWNLLVAAGLMCCSETTCEMDMTALYETAVANAGSKAAFLEELFGCVSGETLSYSNGVFTATASISSLAPLFADANGVTVQEQLDALGAAVDASALDMACDIEIKADFQSVGTARTIGISYAVKTADGSYALLGDNGFAAYLAGKVSEFAAAVEAAELPDDTAVAAQAIAAECVSRTTFANVGMDAVLDQNVSVTADSLNTALTSIEASHPEYADKIPASAETVAQILESSWNSLFAQINENFVPEGGSISLDVHEVAAIFDSLTNVTLTLAGGNLTISGTLEDTQTDAVKAYFAEDPAALAALADSAVQAGDGNATGLSAYEDGMTIDATAKTVEATLPLTMLESGSGNVYYNIYRTYTFSTSETTEPAATETTPVSTETETTETSDDTTVSETTVTEVTETSDDTTVSETTVTEVTETSDDTTVSETTVTEVTETSDDTTVSETTVTEVTETSDDTTISETTVTSEDAPDWDDDDDCDHDDSDHCGKDQYGHHHHHRHDDGICPEWDWTKCPDWNWEECPDWNWEECPDWNWEECPDWNWEECPDWNWEECPDWNWEECPDWNWEECAEGKMCPFWKEWLENDGCKEQNDRGHGGNREEFRKFRDAFSRFEGMNFNGGTPSISLNRD